VISTPSPECQGAFNRARNEARSSRFRDDADVRQHTVRMYGRLSEMQQQVSASHHVHFDCRPGCSHCCHLRVEIRPHSAFVLADHIRTTFTPEQRARALARIEENLARIGGLTPEQHNRAAIPCALLENGVCTVYDARPATCRKYHSVSAETCRRVHDDPTASRTGAIEDDEVRMAGNAIALGFAKGLEDAGYDIELYELHRAVHQALTNPRASKRYRKGKRAFV
jgi:Fe-S-cluster containining protein